METHKWHFLLTLGTHEKEKQPRNNNTQVYFSLKKRFSFQKGMHYFFFSYKYIDFVQTYSTFFFFIIKNHSLGWSLPNKPAETTRRHLHRFTQLNQTRVQTQTDVRRHRATLLRHSRSQVSGQHALWLQNGVTDASPSNGSPAAKNSKCPWSIEAMKMEVDLFFFFYLLVSIQSSVDVDHCRGCSVDLSVHQHAS